VEELRGWLAKALRVPKTRLHLTTHEGDEVSDDKKLEDTQLVFCVTVLRDEEPEEDS